MSSISATSGPFATDNVTAGAMSKYVPVASIELTSSSVEITQALALKIGEKIVEQFKKQHIYNVQQQGPILFFQVIDEQLSLEAALNKAFKILVALVQKKITLPQGTIEIKAGLDICFPTYEDVAISSVNERLVAAPGQLVVGKRLYELCQNQLPFEIIGPVAINGASHVFYRLEPNALTPVKHNATPPVEVVPETISPSQNTQNILVETSKVAPRVQHTASSIDIPIDAHREEQQSDMLLFDFDDLPEVEFSHFVNTDVSFSDIPLLRYQPPIYCQFTQQYRKPQLPFSQVVPALFGVLSQWLQQQRQAGSLSENDFQENQSSPFIGLFSPEAGGKTTIFSLVRNQLPQDQFIWINSGYYASMPVADSQESLPLSYWAELLQNILGLPVEGIPREHFDEHFNQVLEAIWGFKPPEEYSEVFKNVLGISASSSVIPPALADSNLDTTIAAFMALFHHLSQKAPVIVVMEDIERADIASLQLLMSLLDAGLLNMKVLLIISSQPQVQFNGALSDIFQEQRLQEWVTAAPEQSDLISIVEAPLTIPIKKLPPVIQNQLTLPSVLPMYIEESLRLLMQQGALEHKNKENKFAPTKNIKSVVLPATIDAVLKERIAALPEEAKQVLETASILGYRFSNQLLAGLLPDPSKLDPIIKQLWELGFVIPENQLVSQFRHRLVWQVVYNSIEPVQRASKHQYVFSLLEQLFRQNTMHPNVLLEQAVKSGNHYAAIRTATRLTIPTLSHLGFSHSVNGLLQQCQAMLQSETGSLRDETYRNLCYEIGFRNRLLNPQLAVQYLATLQNDPVIIGDKLAIRDVLQALAECCSGLGLYEKQLQLLLKLFFTTPEDERRFIPKDVIIHLAQSMHVQGYYRGLIGFVEQCLLPTPESTLETMPVAIQNMVLEALLYRCQPNAKKHLEKLLLAQMDDLNSNRVDIGLKYVLQALLSGSGEAMRGLEERFNSLLETLETDEKTTSDMICNWGLARIQYLLSVIALDTTNHQNILNELKIVLDSTLSEAESSFNYRTIGFCKVYAGWTQLLDGDVTRAIQSLELAMEFATQYRLSHVMLVAWRLAAEICLHQNNTAKAQEYIQHALTLATDPFVDNRSEYHWLLLIKARLLMQHNEWQEAGSILESTWPILARIRQYPLMLEASELIATLYENLSNHAAPANKEKYLNQKENFTERARALKQEMAIA